MLESKEKVYVGVEVVKAYPMKLFDFLQKVREEEEVPFGTNYSGYCVNFSTGSYTWMSDHDFKVKYREDARL